MIPKELRSLFWDINQDIFNPLDYPDYTIGRVLEFGDRKAVGWIKRTFTEPQIIGVLRNERRLSRRSANFWALIYHIPASEVAAIKSVA